MGFIHLITGDGKGKTTAAVGMAVRTAGFGRRAAFIQFDKGFDGENEHYNERHVLRRLDEIDVFPFGCERMMPDGTFRFGNDEDDLAEARRALAKSREAALGGDYYLVVLDEILSARAYKLIEQADVLALMDAFREANPAECDLVLTGRSATAPMIERADLVSEIRAVKHYFEDGVAARPGIDY